jgi:cyanophycinase
VAPEAASEGLDELEIRDGLGLIGVTTQAQADEACLLDRAVAALQQGPATSALALDKGSCLVISSTTGGTKVYGAGRVTWLARHGDQVSLRCEHAAADSHHGADSPADDGKPDASGDQSERM